MLRINILVFHVCFSMNYSFKSFANFSFRDFSLYFFLICNFTNKAIFLLSNVCYRHLGVEYNDMVKSKPLDSDAWAAEMLITPDRQYWPAYTKRPSTKYTIEVC